MIHGDRNFSIFLTVCDSHCMESQRAGKSLLWFDGWCVVCVGFGGYFNFYLVLFLFCLFLLPLRCLEEKALAFLMIL